jgi:hypothetical protein
MNTETDQRAAAPQSGRRHAVGKASMKSISREGLDFISGIYTPDCNVDKLTAYYIRVNSLLIIVSSSTAQSTTKDTALRTYVSS